MATRKTNVGEPENAHLSTYVLLPFQWEKAHVVSLDHLSPGGGGVGGGYKQCMSSTVSSGELVDGCAVSLKHFPPPLYSVLRQLLIFNIQQPHPQIPSAGKPKLSHLYLKTNLRPCLQIET